ncbi:uncharacterized protein B0T15DRAFT_391864 [Chaetomium strumarium]|uniref:Glycoside hydrolase subgroup catalytic core protein n=1 Tax=Chaetomium strumarium TaxID=1170767 RepID=A0AAJ0GZ07_9PEZI|nr:hypothetical protein B0T15DRAFT_391864 [Chaetomium strumarium]
MTGSWIWLILIAAVVNGQQTGSHPDWPRWCGKPYQPGYPNFDPGGQTLPPAVVPGPRLIHVQFQPRYSLYLDGEQYGEFIVNAELSQYHGLPWPNSSSSSKGANKLVFSINLVEDDEPLVQNTVSINTKGSLFSFELSRLGKPRLEPIPVVLYGAPEGGVPTFTVTGSLSYLPEKTNGSVTRIDNLHGGLWVRNAASKRTFTPFFPYGFYASYDGFLRNNDTSLIQRTYTSLGLNAMTPLTTYFDAPAMLDYMSQTNLRFMYDLREGYKNLSYVRANTLAARDLDGLFAYWTADEPDGWQDPFFAPLAAYDLIRALDPYHPVGVVLNCQNYYFGPYSAAAGFLMADVYPIGINSTYSKWGTPCNETYGDCGCDNCGGIVQDVVSRLEDWNRYETWLGRWRKTRLFNPQAFHGEDYWLRDPSAGESWVMVMLAVNHGAQGIISWVWPTSDVLAGAHGALAKVLTSTEVAGFVVGGDGPGRIDVEVPGTDVVDVARWVVDGKMLVSVVNGGYVDVDSVEVSVPNATVIESTPWGSVDWKLEGESLSVALLPALATSLVVVDLRG